MTLNAVTLFPITLSCPIVQNSPRGFCCKSRRNQMREKSITPLSPLSPPWLNYWNKMLHLEESLERRRGKRGEVGERETLLGTWVPFRLGPSSLRKPLKAENDPPSCPWLGRWFASCGWVNSEHALRFWGQMKIIKRNINFPKFKLSVFFGLVGDRRLHPLFKKKAEAFWKQFHCSSNSFT